MATKVSVFVFIALSFLILSVNSALAADLQFDPTTANVTTGQTVEIKINIDTGTDSVTSADAVITYNQSYLTVNRVTAGTFFSNISSNLNTAGKAYINAMTNSLSEAKTGSGHMATIVFQATSPGTVSLNFDCTSGSSTDSNIIKNDANATDVIVCSSNGTASITISGNITQPTPTLIATPTTSLPVISVTPPPALPRSGAFENMLSIIMGGVGFVAIGLFLLSTL
jgi:hypothetical protein